MTLNTFLCVVDAVMAEEKISFHVETPTEAPVPTPAENRARNQDAMAAFNSMMGGVQKGGRRR